jgi:hypothetical protein
VTNQDDGNLSQYTVGTNGVLTPMSTPTVTVGTSAAGVATARAWH